ncbi:hypothetical protein BRX36_19275 [Sphingomonas sp. S-NIH.Pt1_0416]|jgi:hypothetical protein|uniref:hypothetical protein n=1 Tax=Sphingomonas sp. S-NIH.Pt1_0416 TaxID=1920123 RepID=UPI000F7E7664|nr:hypothetical protein [Sphingomonas sp. S-NIH.Pt1_0416]RSU59310.1 hypothetical protein BRX36_19275 [Sphingomonas sp. S-NIH.Pt1_0416]
MAVVELPNWAVPNSASPAFMDFGAVLRPSTGAALLRVDRLGSRYKLTLGFPPFDDPDQGRVIVSRLIRAKRMGLRVEVPLLAPQVIEDAIVDGAGQAGTTLRLRGLFPRRVVREGYWLSVEKADGQHFLHNVAGESIADAAGKVALPLSEMLRWPFADGARVHLVRPMIEGLVDGNEQAWSISVEKFTHIEFTVEEAA